MAEDNAGPWRVIAQPEGDNPSKLEKFRGKNTGGLIIRLRNNKTGQEQEVSRVLYVRRNSGNPKKGFDAQLQAELRKAQRACDTLNELGENAEELV